MASQEGLWCKVVWAGCWMEISGTPDILITETCETNWPVFAKKTFTIWSADTSWLVQPVMMCLRFKKGKEEKCHHFAFRDTWIARTVAWRLAQWYTWYKNAKQLVVRSLVPGKFGVGPPWESGTSVTYPHVLANKRSSKGGICDRRIPLQSTPSPNFPKSLKTFLLENLETCTQGLKV